VDLNGVFVVIVPLAFSRVSVFVAVLVVSGRWCLEGQIICRGCGLGRGP
jgi:hypothetical protein